MNEPNYDQLLERLLEKPGERERLLAEADLNEHDRSELNALLRTADLVWLNAYQPPPLNDDPVAALLGLVPDPQCRLNPAALARARRGARLDIVDVVNRLSAAGRNYQVADIFRWETRNADDVPPVAIKAIAEAIGVDIDTLIATGVQSPTSALDEVLTGHRFDELVRRWADVMKVPFSVAAAELRARTFATVHRGSAPDGEQVIASLEALVVSVEQREAGPT